MVRAYRGRPRLLRTPVIGSEGGWCECFSVFNANAVYYPIWYVHAHAEMHETGLN